MSFFYFFFSKFIWISFVRNQIECFSEFSHFDSPQQMGRIHSIFLQTIVPTGRLACIDPNLMCVAKPISILDENQNEVVINIRNAFVASPGHKLLSVDYSQLEIRLMANFSKDPHLVSILQGGGDIFKQISSQWFKKPIDQITPSEREQSKQICYVISKFPFQNIYFLFQKKKKGNFVWSRANVFGS